MVIDNLNIFPMKNKKGIFFTLIVIAILSLFLVYYSFNNMNTNRDSVSKRIETMNNFVALVERDLPRQIYISGYRSLVIFEKSIADNGTYIDDTTRRFRELFYNGTFYEEQQGLMSGATFNDIIKSLNDSGSGLNLNVNITNSKIYLTQENPWTIKITLEALLTIIDKGNLASWNRSTVVETYIDIQRFEDPVYVVNTDSKWNRKINNSMYYAFVTGTDTYNLSKMVNETIYISNSDAPSFLDRLMGNLTSQNINGIESLVSIPLLSSLGQEIKTKSVVDHIYFSSDNPASIHMVTNMSDWFKIDDGHTFVYEVNGILRS